MDPAGAEVGAEDFTGRVVGEWVVMPAEVDFPACGFENRTIGLPAFGQAGEQPEANGLMGIVGLDGEPQPGIREAAELAEGGHDDGPIPPGGFVRTVIGGHFRQDKAGEGFLDFQGEQAHAADLPANAGAPSSEFLGNP